MLTCQVFCYTKKIGALSELWYLPAIVSLTTGLMASGYFTFEERLPLLVIHGMLHLVGYNHGPLYALASPLELA